MARIDLDSHVIAKPLRDSLQKWGVLDAPSRKGMELYPEVDAAVASLRKAFETEHHFQLTPGGILAMQHLFFHFYLNDVRQTGKNHFLSSVIEEAPILKALDQMEMMGCGVRLLPVDAEGKIDLGALKEAIGPKTALISISAVCAMTGVMQPVQEVIEICRSKGVKVHINATHAVGAWGVSLKEWDADYLTFDGDKLGAMPGIGGLFSKERLREAMMAPHALISLAEAVVDRVKKQEPFAMEMARLRQTFEEELLRAVPDAVVIGRSTERVPHIFLAAFPGLMNEALLYYLHRRNIEASIGGGQFQTVASILQKCGYPDELAIGGISFALSDTLQEDDLAEALDAIVSSVRNLKKMSAVL